MKQPAKRVRIGEVLLEQGILSQEQITRALADQKTTGKMLGEILVEQNIVPAATLIAARRASLRRGAPSGWRVPPRRRKGD